MSVEEGDGIAHEGVGDGAEELVGEGVVFVVVVVGFIG